MSQFIPTCSFLQHSSQISRLPEYTSWIDIFGKYCDNYAHYASEWEALQEFRKRVGGDTWRVAIYLRTILPQFYRIAHFPKSTFPGALPLLQYFVELRLAVSICVSQEVAEVNLFYGIFLVIEKVEAVRGPNKAEMNLKV